MTVCVPSARTISVVIPALNEEANLQGTLDTVVSVVERTFKDYEIIVVNDGSRDRTSAIIEAAAAGNRRVQCVTHAQPRGFGASFDAGRRLARMHHCVMVHGDNAFDEDTLRNFLSHAGQAQVISGFIANPASRGCVRRLISTAYTWMLNLLFGLRLKYFNGLQIHETEWLRGVRLSSRGFAFQAELVIKALGERRTHLEVPYRHRERPAGGKTKIFKIRNIISVGRTILSLYSKRCAGVHRPNSRA